MRIIGFAFTLIIHHSFLYLPYACHRDCASFISILTLSYRRSISTQGQHYYNTDTTVMTTFYSTEFHSVEKRWQHVTATEEFQSTTVGRTLGLLARHCPWCNIDCRGEGFKVQKQVTVSAWVYLYFNSCSIIVKPTQNQSLARMRENIITHGNTTSLTQIRVRCSWFTQYSTTLF